MSKKNKKKPKLKIVPPKVAEPSPDGLNSNKTAPTRPLTGSKRAKTQAEKKWLKRHRKLMEDDTELMCYFQPGSGNEVAYAMYTNPAHIEILDRLQKELEERQKVPQIQPPRSRADAPPPPGMKREGKLYVTD